MPDVDLTDHTADRTVWQLGFARIEGEVQPTVTPLVVAAVAIVIADALTAKSILAAAFAGGAGGVDVAGPTGGDCIGGIAATVATGTRLTGSPAVEHIAGRVVGFFGDAGILVEVQPGIAILR